MDFYFMEFLIKDRQRQISDEFRRIHLSRSLRRSNRGFIKGGFPVLLEFLFARRANLENRFRRAIEKPTNKENHCRT